VSTQVPALTFELAAEGRSVPRARGWIVAFAQEHITDRIIVSRVALAFTEAFTNAVRHAYEGPDPRGNDICVSADVEHDSLEIVVVDHGDGFRAERRDPGLGMGLTVVAEAADAFSIRERAPSGTEVWMRFDLPPERAD
jgi:anti-sigma regulatory factor (Ser/Thr protein kinase)